MRPCPRATHHSRRPALSRDSDAACPVIPFSSEQAAFGFRAGGGKREVGSRPGQGPRSPRRRARSLRSSQPRTHAGPVEAIDETAMELREHGTRTVALPLSPPAGPPPPARRRAPLAHQGLHARIERARARQWLSNLRTRRGRSGVPGRTDAQNTQYSVSRALDGITRNRRRANTDR